MRRTGWFLFGTGVLLALAATILPVPRWGDPVWAVDLPGDSARGTTPPLTEGYGTAADLDLRLVRITPAAAGWHLDITLAQLPNPLDFPSGYAIPQIDLLGTDPAGTGDAGDWQLPHPGSNVRIAGAIRQQIRVNPGGAWWRTAPDGEAVSLPQTVVGNVIRVDLPASFEPPREGVVLVGAYNMLAPDGYREVTADATTDTFGGGEDGQSDPHVLDVIGSPKRLQRQADEPLVTLTPVRLKSPPLWRELLWSIAAGLILLGLGLRRRAPKPKSTPQQKSAPPALRQYLSAGGKPPRRRRPSPLRTLWEMIRNLPDLWRTPPRAQRPPSSQKDHWTGSTASPSRYTQRTRPDDRAH